MCGVSGAQIGCINLDCEINLLTGLMIIKSGSLKGQFKYCSDLACNTEYALAVRSVGSD